jgi:lysophospholipase L1-like esterase
MCKDVQKQVQYFISLLLALLVMLMSGSSVLAATANKAQFIGPKKYYLALGDSLAFGYQPNGDYTHGYVADFLSDLQNHGLQSGLDLGCPGETSQTFIMGHCPYAPSIVIPPQLPLAIAYLRLHSGQVSPVTLDIGANDILKDSTISTCTVNTTQFTHDLNTLDFNLHSVILPALSTALNVNRKPSGDILVMNYYDSYQNLCPRLLPYTQLINAHIAQDVASYATVVDVFRAFGGAKTPNPNLCTYTWICATKPDIHSTTTGYQVIAHAFEQTYGY